jgi:DNA-binding transcriptional LysR family regulator
MDILQLQYFQTIARLENLTKASELLYIAQPNLSVSMKRLEEDLGIALFDRRKGRIRLTPTGKIFLSYVDRVLEDLNTGISEARAVEAKAVERVRVASVIIDLVGNLLDLFLPEHAEISFEHIHCHNDEVLEKIRRDEADFGFIFGDPQDDGMEYIEIDHCERVAQLAASHPLAGQGMISLSELNGQRLICNLARDDSALFDGLFRTGALQPGVFYRCDDNRVEVSMLNGGGVSIAPISNYIKLTREFPGQDLACLRIRERLPEARLGMVRPTGRHLSAASLQFYQMVSRFFRREDEIRRAYIQMLPER